MPNKYATRGRTAKIEVKLSPAELAYVRERARAHSPPNTGALIRHLLGIVDQPPQPKTRQSARHAVTDDTEK
jgi:hypothetical protein